MPTIAIIDGVRVFIHPKDHLPPHIHAIFGGAEAQFSIVTGELLHGSLPKAKMRLVQGWLDANRAHVAYIWREVRADRYDRGTIA